MGILNELFSVPVYGRNGARGDVALPAPGMYQRGHSTHYDDVEAARQRLWELMHAARSGSLGSLAEIQALEQIVGEAEAEHLRNAATPGLRRWHQPSGTPLPPLPPPAVIPETKPQLAQSGTSGTGRSAELRQRRNSATPEENLALLGKYLTGGEMTRDALLRRSQLKSFNLQAALDAGLKSGKLALRTEWGGGKEPTDARGRSTHGRGSEGEFWSLAPEQPQPTQASRYWLQAPPGGAQLGGRPYRSGQFIPGTTMFTHTPRKPPEPVMYDPAQERAAFEAAIDEDPLETTNHLVFADWLDEQGDEEEAMFRRSLAEWMRTRNAQNHPFQPDVAERATRDDQGRVRPWTVMVDGDFPEGVDSRLIPSEWNMRTINPNTGLPHIPEDQADFHGARLWPDNRLYWPHYRGWERALRQAFRRPTQNSRAANYGPVPYAPLPEPPQQPGMTQTGVAPQPDGTWAMPTPPTAGQGVPGAPQTVGGAAMFPQQPGTPPTTAPQSPQNNPSGLAVAAPPQARPDPSTPQLVRTPGLSPEDMVLEAQTQQFAWANYPALRDMYFQTNAVLDPVSGDVRSLRIDADAWRELLPGYTGTNATATHAAAVYLNSQLFKEALQNQAGKGNNRMMVLAGGGGSGKGTAVNQFLETAEFPLILDQTSRDYGKLAGQFEAARAAGMQPSYLFVDRPAPTALHGAVERAIAERRAGRPARTVPLEMLARTNIDARRVALQVMFAQPDVDAQVIDNRNTGRFQRRMITDRNDAAQYLAHRLREDEDALNNGAIERLRDEILARNKKGEIPADMVTGFLGEGWHIRPPVPLTPRRHGQ